MATNTFKILGPVHGYARGEGIRVRAFTYKNESQAKQELKREVERMQSDLEAKVSVIGAGEGVPASFRKHIETYECDTPDWTVPRMQVHFGIPARDLPGWQASTPDEPASAPPPKSVPKQKPKMKKMKADKPARSEPRQASLWDDFLSAADKAAGGK